ncbi:MAG: acyl-CoA reductase [Cytophagales bacterium]
MNHKINTLKILGDKIKTSLLPDIDYLARAVQLENPWFTKSNVEIALTNWANCLTENNINLWLNNTNPTSQKKKIGIVAAGNIPLVSLHDILCVYVSGHEALIKLSNQDTFLTKEILKILNSIEPETKESIQITERLNNADATIATGSNNSARYFEHYFGKKPNIIRKNRTSVAIISGNETEEELKELNKDIFTYFGLGCRNVGKIYIPERYNLEILFKSIEKQTDVLESTKFMNNYDYNKAVYLLNKVKIYDTNNLIIKESSELYSPVGCINFEYYKTKEDLHEKLRSQKNNIQCIISENQIELNIVKFGQSQYPNLNDYADDVNTLDFLLNLQEV